jgi:hypothetical protein
LQGFTPSPHTNGHDTAVVLDFKRFRDEGTLDAWAADLLLFVCNANNVLHVPPASIKAWVSSMWDQVPIASKRTGRASQVR